MTYGTLMSRKRCEKTVVLREKIDKNLVYKAHEWHKTNQNASNSVI